MKTKIIILSTLIFNFLLIGCSEDDNQTIQNSCDFIDFKYYNGAQDYLGEMSNDYLLIGIDTTYSDSQIQTFISNLAQFDQSYNYSIHHIGNYKFKEIPLKFTSSKTCEEITQIISDMEQNQIISYAHYTMQTDNCENLIWEPIGDLCVNSYGSNFYVKVFDENDLTNLNQVLLQTNTELVEQNQFMPKWYELRATKTSNGDALEMANYFYETGLFEYSEPGISKYPVE
jgi:hypothetical protein